MTRLELEPHDDLIQVIKKIANINDSGIELVIPEEAILLENILNLKLLQSKFDKEGKTIHFTTSDEAGKILIDMLDGEGSTDYPAVVGDFGFGEASEKRRLNILGKLNGLALGIKVPQLNLAGLKFGKKHIILLAGAVLLFGLGFCKLLKSPRAHITIVVDSQPLVRSFSIRVVKDISSDAATKVLAGKSASASTSGMLKGETTGEKMVGKKAEGEIKIFNKTNVDIELKKGTKVAFKDISTDLFYVLEDSVTIPKLSPQDPSDPASPLIPGEVTVSVSAVDVGDKYNIKDGQTLEFEDYKKSEVEAKTNGKISGGKSEIIKTVTQEDKNVLSAKLLEQLSLEVAENLKEDLKKDQKLIDGSVGVTITEEKFNYDIDDEVSELELTQMVSATGLIYSKNDLNELFEELVAEFIPDDFEIAGSDFDIGVEVLGNSDSTVLNSTMVDLQVTAKTSVVPIIEKDKLKESLRGLTLPEAEKILGSITGAKTYGINISPGIPLLRRIPKDTGKIFVEVSNGK